MLSFRLARRRYLRVNLSFKIGNGEFNVLRILADKSWESLQMAELLFPVAS
jgi:hypothetical protein